jgi:flagellar biosynthetic protein FliQ
MRMLRMKGKMLLRHLLYKRKVRKLLYFTYNVPFPGGKGVSIYHVLSYFLVSSLGGGSIPQRAKGLAYSFLAALPPLLISMVIGLLISIFQTVTSIQEQTLTFVPKLLAIFLTLMVGGNWMLNNMITFMKELWSDFSIYIH